jgi:deoxyxylulose-5-phosphate synthase
MDESLWVDTSNKQTRKDFKKYREKQQENTSMLFKKLGIDYINVKTSDDYNKALIKLFANRERL